MFGETLGEADTDGEGEASEVGACEGCEVGDDEGVGLAVGVGKEVGETSPPPVPNSYIRMTSEVSAQISTIIIVTCPGYM